MGCMVGRAPGRTVACIKSQLLCRKINTPAAPKTSARMEACIMHAHCGGGGFETFEELAGWHLVSSGVKIHSSQGLQL